MDAPHGTCMGCERPLLQPGGFWGTDLCGPCCTGESATLEHVSIVCPVHGNSERHQHQRRCCAQARLSDRQGD